MSTLVRIITQYQENYAFADGGTPHWKNKGELEFTVKVDLDHLMYAKEEVEAAIREMLEKHHSNDASRVELISFEPIFHTPEAFDQIEFNNLLDKKIKLLSQ